MAYISSIHENTYTLETDGNEQQVITLDGTSLAVDWRQIAPLASDAQGHVEQGGRYTLLIGETSYEVFARCLARSTEGEGLTYEILIAGERFEVHVENERERALLGSLKSSQIAGEIAVRAPMPGLVLNVLKEAGDEVERGETVVVLEAMKMENDLTSPHSGTIKEVRVSKGQTVNQGDILLIVTGN